MLHVIIFAITCEEVECLNIINTHVLGGGFRTGYATQYIRSFLHMIQHLKDKHGLLTRIFSVEYTLSPETTYPTAQNECVRSYEYLVKDLNISPSRIIVGKSI